MAQGKHGCVRNIALLEYGCNLPQQKTEAGEKASMCADVLVGWCYLTARAGLIAMLIYFALVNFLLNLSAVLTAQLTLSFAQASSLRLAQSAAGLGMLVGSIFMMGAAMIIIGLKPSMLPFGSGSSRALAGVAPQVQCRVFATRSVVSTSMMPLAFLLAEPLADQVFGPPMSEDGNLATTIAGQLLGAGAECGIGRIFVLSDITLLIVTAVAYAYPCMRLLEDEFPDAVPDVVEEQTASDAETPVRSAASRSLIASFLSNA
jgi:MFS transporter, DHA3 family, macrolide efflux protein